MFNFNLGGRANVDVDVNTGIDKLLDKGGELHATC